MYDEAKLLIQCSQCVRTLIASGEIHLPECQIEIFTRQVTDQVVSNGRKGRVPQMDCDPETGVPSSYINAIIHYKVNVGSKIKQLKNGNKEYWDEIGKLIKRRVIANLERVGKQYGHRYDGLVDDLILQCTYDLWFSLDRYTYDTQLEKWVRQFVAFAVSDVRRGADFRWNNTARFLDHPIGSGEETSTLGELLPDGEAMQTFEKVDCYLTIEAASQHLNDLQHEVIWRTLLLGQTTQDIARHMGVSRNYVYLIRHRAVKTLREHIY